jgi:hypothetical protein
MLGELVSDAKRAISLQRGGFFEMHERYGPIVRAGKYSYSDHNLSICISNLHLFTISGPNTVWVSSASSIRKVNGTHQYIKGDDYEKTRTGEPNVFNTR